MSGLNKSFEDVKQFHKAFAHPAPDSPTPQSVERAEARSNF
jgi:predicted HAD superfamily Cof-like phosphohydrolase